MKPGELPAHPPGERATLGEKVAVLVHLAHASALLCIPPEERREWDEWLARVASTIGEGREPGKPRRCSRCGEPGHRTTTCTSLVVIDGWTDERVNDEGENG